MEELDKQFNRIFVTGDIHGDMNDLADRIAYISDTTKDDLLIILGACAFFYSVYYNEIEKGYARQKFAAKLPLTILCIQGNHEQPSNDTSIPIK